MLLERLLYPMIQSPDVFAVLDLTIYVAGIGLLVLFLWYFLNTKNFLDLVKAKHGKLAIIVDEGSRTIHYYPLPAGKDFNAIKGRGIRVWDTKATYLDPAHKCQVGLFNGKIAVNLPLDFASAIEKGDLEQLTLKGFEKWLGRVTSPYVWQEELESKARMLAGLNELDKTGKGFSLKWLVIIGAGILIFAVILGIFGA